MRDFVDELAEFVGRNLPNEFVEAIESQLRWGGRYCVAGSYGAAWDWIPTKNARAKYVELDRLTS